MKHPPNHPKNPKKPLFLAIFSPFLAIFTQFLPKFSAHFFFQNWAKAHFFWPQTDQTGLVRTNLTNFAHFFWPLPTFLPTFLDKTGRGFWTFFSHFRPNLDKKKRDCISPTDSYLLFQRGQFHTGRIYFLAESLSYFNVVHSTQAKTFNLSYNTL